MPFQDHSDAVAAVGVSFPVVAPLKTYGSLHVLSAPLAATINDVNDCAFFDHFDVNFETYDLLSIGTRKNRNWSWAVMEYSTSATIQDFTHALLATGFKMPFLAASNSDGRVCVMVLRTEKATLYAKHVGVSLGQSTITPGTRRFKLAVGADQIKEKTRVMLELFGSAFRSYMGNIRWHKVDEVSA